MHERPGVLIDRYARRMLIDNAIEDAVPFFHMDAPSSTVPLRTWTCSLPLSPAPCTGALARRLPKAYATAKCRTLFNHFVRAPATVITRADQIIVQLTRRAHNNQLRAAGHVGSQGRIPWMHGRELIIDYT